MKRHTKVYLDYFGLDASDFLSCEICWARGIDIHHIDSRKMGGTKGKDVIENLMLLCRTCHEKYGDRKQFKVFLQTIHNQKLTNYGTKMD
jgi:5-methylcytosine-specific restriction endonuclease McrA